MQKSVVLGMILKLFGPAGFLWKVPNCSATAVKMRLCHFGIKFDLEEPRPSGSYLQLATTAKVSTKLWQCKRNVPIQEHTLDWYGKHEAHGVWRRKTAAKLIDEVIKAFDSHGNLHSEANVILDDTTSPLPISDNAIPVPRYLPPLRFLTTDRMGTAFQTVPYYLPEGA